MCSSCGSIVKKTPVVLLPIEIAMLAMNITAWRWNTAL
jgi:hypothetical protein